MKIIFQILKWLSRSRVRVWDNDLVQQLSQLDTFLTSQSISLFHTVKYLNFERNWSNYFFLRIITSVLLFSSKYEHIEIKNFCADLTKRKKEIRRILEFGKVAIN